MLNAIFNFTTLWWIMMILYVPACLGLIGVVLLQKGKGAGFAGAFGVGAGSETVFGPRASRSLPVRLTHIMAAVFMILAMAMSLVAGRAGHGVAPEAVTPSDSESSVTSLPPLKATGDTTGSTGAVVPGSTSGAATTEGAAGATTQPAPAVQVVPDKGATSEKAPAPAQESSAPAKAPAGDAGKAPAPQPK